MRRSLLTEKPGATWRRRRANARLFASQRRWRNDRWSTCGL